MNKELKTTLTIQKMSKVTTTDENKRYVNLPDLLKRLKEQGVIVTETTDTSLTSPMDQVNDSEKNRKQARNARKFILSENELDAAIDSLVRQWPAVEKRLIDPPIEGQTYCCLSFMPSSGATPDKDGIYGFIKVRGAFDDEVSCDAYAEKILNECDSFHAIYHGMMGHPLPLVKDDDDRYCMEVQNVALKQKIKEEMSKNVRQHREDQKKFIEETERKIKEDKEKEEASIRGEVDYEERYITLRVKRANLIFTLYQMLTGLKRFKDTLNETIDILAEMDEKYPTFQQTFLAKYNYAAEQAGIPKEKNNILRYMVGDIPFSLSQIPDVIDVADVSQPLVIPIDVNSLDYHAIADKMAKSAKEAVSTNEESKE